MLREFAGRRVIPTTLDPVPPLFRTVPHHIVINHGEMAELEREYLLPRGSATPVFKRLIDIAQRADDDDERAAARRQTNPRRRSQRAKRRAITVTT